MVKKTPITYSQAQSEKCKSSCKKSSRYRVRVNSEIGLMITFLILLEKIQHLKAAAVYYEITAQTRSQRSPSVFDLPYSGNLGLRLIVTKNDNSTGVPIVTNQTTLNYQHTINSLTYQKQHTIINGTGYTTENKASFDFISTLYNCLNPNAISAAYLSIAALLFEKSEGMSGTLTFNENYTQFAQLYGSVSNIPYSAFNSTQNAQLILFSSCINIAAAEKSNYYHFFTLGGIFLMFLISISVYCFCSSNDSRENRNRVIPTDTPFTVEGNNAQPTPIAPTVVASEQTSGIFRANPSQTQDHEDETYVFELA